MTTLLRSLSSRARVLSLICASFIALTLVRLVWRGESRPRPRRARSRYAYSGFRRFACLAMVVLMFFQGILTSPQVSHAAVKAVSATAINYAQDAHFRWHSSGWAARYERFRNEYLPGIGAQAQPKSWDGRGAPRQSRPAPQAAETRQDREQKIARIKIFPGDVEIKTGEQVVFNAIAFDRDGNPVSGLDAQWSALHEEKNQQLTITSAGTFVSGVAGRFTVTAEIAGRKEQVKVTVTGEARRLNLKSRSEEPKSSSESRRVGSLRAPASGDQKRVARRGRQSGIQGSKQAGMAALPGLRAASAPMASRPALLLSGEDETGWNSGNHYMMDRVGSERGGVPGRAIDGGAGSSNFQFAAPGVVLDGRGIDLNVLFNYNSRLWQKAGSEITFDIDRDWIPGWSLGFGKIVMAGDTYILIDGDGTRHQYNGTLRRGFPSPASALQSFEGYTTDGTFIDYYAEGYQPQFDNSGGRNMILAWAVMPNGTRIEYSAQANYAIYPTRITDASGNFINITYRNNQGPNIETITDTLGRVIYFYYDGSGLLTSIVVPGLNGGSRVAVRLQYQWLTLSNAGANYGFAGGLTTKVRQNTIPVIKAIYYPGTGTGYWFGDGDSYSPYGMIRKVSERRGMTFDNAPLDQQGNIGPGTMSQEMVYNYPQSGGSYSDMPTYTQMVDDWAGRVTDAAPVTYFSVVDSGGLRTTTITRPDGAQMAQVTDINQGSATYGMLLEDTLTRDGAVLSRSKAFWEVGSYNSPRPTRTETTDERERTMATAYSYDPAYGSRYNSVTDARSYGYSGELLRRTHTEYLNDGNYNGSLQNSGTLWARTPGVLSPGPIWGGSHIFNLVTLNEDYAEDDVTRLSRTEYQYDGRDLIDNPGMVQYDARTGYRGNVTQVKRYADAVSLNQDTAVIYTRTYDVAGNLRVQTTSCCEQMSYTYTTNTQYAWPESQTSGSPSDPALQNVTSATYDYNTGLIKTSTDANGRVSQTVYDANNLRPVYEYAPTEAYQYHIYDDQNLKVEDYVYEAGQSGANIASRSDRYLDGPGRVIKEIAYGKDYAQDVVETKFDNLGRLWQQSRPYRPGAETPQWSVLVYDSLDRPIQNTNPDGSAVTRAYNQSPDPAGASGQPGQTVKVTDPWGRERWARSDALGRLAEVAEPNPGGNGSLAAGAMFTTYSYDALDRLLQVNQGAQTRLFRYDSLGRLTHQKLAERDAALGDNGQWIGSGQWSDVFFYDTRSNLTQRVDARGVRTYFNFNDPLNRLLAVQYDKSGAPGYLSANIPVAPNVSYAYMTTLDKRRVQNVFVDQGMGNETMSYDSEGRLSRVVQTFTGRESYPIVTDYIWDTLDRLKESTYPQQYGAGEIRKKVEPAYDIASRIESLKFGGVTLASNPVYNASSQTTSLNVGSQIAENYNYDPKTGLMTGQQVIRGTTETLLDLKYNYTLNNDANNNGPKTGQLTSVTDLKNQARNRAYEYDKLGRLIKVKGGVNAFTNPTWNQTYSYDRYGNRSLVQHTELAMAPVNPGSQSRSDLIGKIGRGAGGAANRIFSAFPTDQPFAAPGINEGYGPIAANSSNSDNTGTPVRGGPRVTAEEYGNVPSANGVGRESLAEHPTGAAPSAPRKEYGYRGGRSPAAAQSSIITVYPSAYQSPDPGQGPYYAVTSPSNTGHGSTTAYSDDYIYDSPKSCIWTNFQSISAQVIGITLKFDWTENGVVGTSYYSYNAWFVQYSIDGGASWVTIFQHNNVVAANAGSSQITLSANQNISQVQVRTQIAALADTSDTCSLTSSISNIRLEAERDITPPVVSNVAAGGINLSSATITWNTNENSDSQVEYGTTTAYGQSTILNSSLVTAHSQGLFGLKAGTVYHYRVRSRDANSNLAVSGDYTFTTTPLVISNVAAGGIASFCVTITWNTNENTDSQVEYGTTTAYGQFSPTTPNPALVTAHSQFVNGLTAETVYHYRVRSRDAAGDLAVSGDFTFTTGSLVASNITAGNITLSSATMVLRS